jgi:hypothetical protein
MNRQHTILIERLETSAVEFSDVVAKIPNAQLMRVPQNGEWSLHMSLSHLRDTEVQVFAYRVDLILKHDTPQVVQNFDQEEWLRAHYSAKEPSKNILAEYRAARRKLIKLLRGTTDKDWSRYAIHPEYGNIPTEYIALHAYNHTLEHLHQFLNAQEENLLQAANKS